MLWKKKFKTLLPIFLQNILYKTLFATNFVRNTCEFYNFVENNYPRSNYLPIKILRKNSRKKSFHANFFNKFVRKFTCNMRICTGARNLYNFLWCLVGKKYWDWSKFFFRTICVLVLFLVILEGSCVYILCWVKLNKINFYVILIF